MPDNSPDPFAYFAGQRTGVKERVAERIREALGRMSALELMNLGDDPEFDKGGLRTALYRIKNGASEPVSSKLLHLLAAPFGIDLAEAFGPFNDTFTEQEQQKWMDYVRQQCVAFGGTGLDPNFTADQIAQLRLFILLTALEQL